MYWHAEPDPDNPRHLTLRGYDAPDGFGRKVKFLAVGQAKLLGDSRAFMFGFLSRFGADLSVGDWRDLARMMRRQYGVKCFDSVRIDLVGRSRDVEFS